MVPGGVRNNCTRLQFLHMFIRFADFETKSFLVFIMVTHTSECCIQGKLPSSICIDTMNSAEVFKNQMKNKNNLPASPLEVHWLCQQMRFWSPTWKPRTPTKQWEGRSSHEKSKASLQGKRNRVWHLSSSSGTQEQPYRSDGNWSCTAVVGLTLIKETPPNQRATETTDSPLGRSAERDLRDTSVTTLLVQ